jgi:phosphoenolpyruvate synthase/pyruvate phosphate dikinase
MVINDLLKNKMKFERIIEFPRTPVIMFEPMLNCYENNSYAKKLGVNYRPAGIVLQDNNYEGWIDLSTKVKITDLDMVVQIITDVRSYNEEAKESFNKIIKQADSFNDKASLKEVILMLNEITSNTYDRFVFFTDELFEITDKEKIQELQEVRMELDDLVTNYLWKAYEKIIKILNEKFEINIKVIENATNEEIIKILGETSNVDINAIADRPIAFVFINGEKSIFTGDDVSKIKEYLISQNPEQTIIQQVKKESVIKGQIGNMGIAKGKVMKFLVSDYHNQEKIDKLSQTKDYILVTPMTQPELISFMKNAAAFVTDEGGITCHAAIIAREMEKPCIIGTKIATQVLNDGDEVEVDADNGIVKLINN